MNDSTLELSKPGSDDAVVIVSSEQGQVATSQSCGLPDFQAMP
jgi:hypothetical protein